MNNKNANFNNNFSHVICPAKRIKKIIPAIIELESGV